MKETIFAISAAFLLLASCYEGEAGGITGRVRAKWIEKYQVVVFVQNTPGRRAELHAARPVLDQKDTTFIPRVLPVVLGTTVEFKNSDSFRHNIFSPDGERYNLGTWVGENGRSYTFKKPGVYRQLCNIHPEMLAHIVVLETPYFALTDKYENFEIASVPSGKYVLRVWGEKLTKEQLARTFDVIVGEGAPVSISIDLLQ
jgi:plastocyanin